MLRNEFGPFDGNIWLNTAHQGPLPRRAAEAAHEAVAWKARPFEMTVERFSGVPAGLREVLGPVIGALPDDIILANSSSYGMHLLANGLPLRAGDEVLLVRGDFPSTILPWLGLQERGIRVRYVDVRETVLNPADLERARSPATRVLCTTWVHSFAGHAIDEQAIGSWCHEHGVTFVLNASQGIGVRRLDVHDVPVDAVTSVGFKWLCGPYGTGFCWIRPEVRERLEYNQAYWLAAQSSRDLEESVEPRVRDDIGARKYDVFGTANFFNFTAWRASIQLLAEAGWAAVEEHSQALVTRLVDGLRGSAFEVVSPRERPRRSTLVFISHRDAVRNRDVVRRLEEAGIYVALRQGRLRVSPHVHNSESEIDRLLEALASI